MISSAPITIIGSLVGNVTGFVAKQYVLIKGLEPVRKAIDEAVTTVAKQHFGAWAGTIFGHQAGLVLALPAASFIGDIVWACVSEVIQATVSCTARTTGLIKGTFSNLSAAALVAIRVFASLISFSVKALIFQYAFPHVKLFLEIILPRLLPALCRYSLFKFYLQPFFTFGAVVVLTTPAVLLLADICGIIVQELVYFACTRLIGGSGKKSS